MALAVEFTHEALEELADVDDLVAIARTLSREADHGRVACGQSNPCVRELLLEGQRVLYRVEREQLVVLGAEPAPVTRH